MNLQEVKIELTNYCKRNCIHCSSDANINNVIQLNIDDVKKVIDECAKLGVKSIVLTGGEATEYKEIEEVINYIKKVKINNIKLYTMCEPTQQKIMLLKNLINQGLTEIIYSLTISLTRDNVLNYDNIGIFLSELSNHTKISFHYCLTTKTINDIHKIEEIINKINYDNFKSLSFLRYVPHGRGDQSLVLSSNDLKELKPTILYLIEKYKDKIHLGSPFNILNITNTPCIAGSENMIIGFNGKVYPCDAMKYFEYLGSGGDIYSSTLEEIYNSTYFTEIRNASKNISDNCKKCNFKNCQGGCLAQKMLQLIHSNEDKLTLKWYQENAFRTKNAFETDDDLFLNAYTGIIGEYGEFFDYMKKFYTHSLTEETKKIISDLAPKELGDLVWYLSVSLAEHYNYTLDEVYDKLTMNISNHYEIDKNLIHASSITADPLCPFNNKSTSYDIDYINNFVILDKEIKSKKDVIIMLNNYKKKLNKFDNFDLSRDEVINLVGEILIETAKILKIMFNKNLSEVLNDNIIKLRERFKEQFEKEVANSRIIANKEYKKIVHNHSFNKK